MEPSTHDLEVSVETARVTVSGKKQERVEDNKGKFVYSEQCSDELRRVIDLPANVDAPNPTSTLKMEFSGARTSVARARRRYPAAC